MPDYEVSFNMTVLVLEAEDSDMAHKLACDHLWGTSRNSTIREVPAEQLEASKRCADAVSQP
jgi:hypothetical protein